MPIITNLQKFDGQVWDNYQLGAKASNILLNNNINVQDSIDNINRQLGGFANKAYENYVNALFKFTNSLNGSPSTADDLEVKVNGTISNYSSKLTQGNTLPEIAGKINWLLTPRTTTASVSAGNNIIRVAQAGVSAECTRDTTKTITFKWDPVTDAGFTNDWIVLCALYPQFTGSNQSMMNCNRYWYQRTKSGDYEAKTFYATVNNRATTRDWYGGSIYWRVLMLYLGG